MHSAECYSMKVQIREVIYFSLCKTSTDSLNGSQLAKMNKYIPYMFPP